MPSSAGSTAACIQLLFIDDHRPNVEAALARGWQAVHFTNPQALAADLARLGLLGT